MLDRALAGTSALMDHGQSGDREFKSTVPDSDVFDLEDSMGGYFEYQPEGSERTQLVHINSIEGRKALDDCRIRFENPSFEPKYVGPSTALKRLLQSSRAHSVIQHGGIGAAATTDLSAAVQQEIEARTAANQIAEAAREEDPDYVRPLPYDPEVEGVALDLHIASSTRRPALTVPVLAPRIPASDGVWRPTDEEYLAASDVQKKKWVTSIAEMEAERNIRNP